MFLIFNAILGQTQFVAITAASMGGFSTPDLGTGAWLAAIFSWVVALCLIGVKLDAVRIVLPLAFAPVMAVMLYFFPFSIGDMGTRDFNEKLAWAIVYVPAWAFCGVGGAGIGVLITSLVRRSLKSK